MIEDSLLKRNVPGKHWNNYDDLKEQENESENDSRSNQSDKNSEVLDSCQAKNCTDVGDSRTKTHQTGVKGIKCFKS
jgi:hypothetical protein